MWGNVSVGKRKESHCNKINRGESPVSGHWIMGEEPTGPAEVPARCCYALVCMKLYISEVLE